MSMKYTKANTTDSEESDVEHFDEQILEQDEDSSESRSTEVLDEFTPKFKVKNIKLLINF